MAKRLTDAQCIEALQAVADHGTEPLAAKALGIPRPTLQSRTIEAKRRGLKADMAKEARTKDAEIKRLRAALKDAEGEEETAEKVREVYYNLAAQTPKPPSWLVEKSTKSGVTGVPMTMWSDWHWGEVVRKVEVGGVNEFNLKIARQRCEYLTKKVVTLALRHMVNPTYPGIVVCLGGDMISGDIHEELAETNETHTLETLLDLQECLIAALTTMADNFGRVFVPCVVGNHGRSDKKPRYKQRATRSFEWHLYCQLERHFANKGDERITFFIPGETDARFDVLGHRFLLTHGDTLGVKGGDGIIGAIGPIMRGAIKVGRSEAQIGRDFDTIVMGHWHQELTLPGVFVNGCLKGYDEYARLALRAPYSRPTQLLWFVHPDHGITAKWPVYLEPLRNKKATTKDFVSIWRKP